MEEQKPKEEISTFKTDYDISKTINVNNLIKKKPKNEELLSNHELLSKDSKRLNDINRKCLSPNRNIISEAILGSNSKKPIYKLDENETPNKKLTREEFESKKKESFNSNERGGDIIVEKLMK